MSIKKDFSVLGKFLKDKRLESGLSQGALSELLGYTNPQPISNCERGLAALPLAKLKKATVLLKIKPEEITEILLDQQRAVYLQTFKEKKSK